MDDAADDSVEKVTEAPSALDELRAKHAALTMELAAAEADATKGPPKTLAQLEADHESAIADLEATENCHQNAENARVALTLAGHTGDEEKIKAAQAAYDAAVKARDDANVSSRAIDVAAQAVLDTREALKAAKGA